MRIKDVQRAPLETGKLAPAEERRGSDAGNHAFKRHMSDVNAAEYQHYIKDLAERIYQQGEIVGQRVDIAEYQKYRALIMELLNETASNAYLFCKTDKFDSRGRHKVFTVIRKVNKRLDELAALVLSDEASNIDMLDIVDDIRGMLVDMLM